MSFELFIQWHDDGNRGRVPRSAVKALFPVSIAESDLERWVVRYDELNSCDIYVGSDPASIDSLTVSRPCADERLWDALFRAMQIGSAVLFFPGCARPLAATAGAVRHLPQDLVAALGEPVQIDTPRAIQDAIRSA